MAPSVACSLITQLADRRVAMREVNAWPRCAAGQRSLGAAVWRLAYDLMCPETQDAFARIARSTVPYPVPSGETNW